ncbi:heavy-metal-associated domain-containing protein, partial [Chryseobacterium arthrosphaerae]
MENKQFQFKTNINCGGCIASVKPHLDKAEGICHWEVDTANKDKVLTVKSEGITEQEVISTVQKA